MADIEAHMTHSNVEDHGGQSISYTAKNRKALQMEASTVLRRASRGNCGQSIREDADINIDQEHEFIGIRHMFETPGEDDEAADVENEWIHGGEGLEGHQIEMPGFGYVEFTTIFTTLARHENCTCHQGRVPDEDPSRNADTEMLSGMHTPTSLHVELSSGENSLESSMVLSTRSASPSAYLTSLASHFTTVPLWLAPEAYFARNMETAFHYPVELSISEEDHSEYDFW
ncbi:hypothetical protein LTR37_002597 [Vermiconidia calcicola]|uniref:Uncharacterized protein n=1 Tax=Vermiconidia calcicola TaxID=1690605 RepID=A0ACC3NS67_9PEZI|nr:hypothetical protein LTR37_002597 [Vermiconidia calcicola]